MLLHLRWLLVAAGGLGGRGVADVSVTVAVGERGARRLVQRRIARRAIGRARLRRCAGARGRAHDGGPHAQCGRGWSPGRAAVHLTARISHVGHAAAVYQAFGVVRLGLACRSGGKRRPAVAS